MRNHPLALAVPLSCLLTLPAAAAPGSPRAPRSDEEQFRSSGSGYVAAVHEALHTRWKTFTEMLHTMPAGTRIHDDRGLSVTLEMKVWPDGTVVRVEPTVTSGLEGFDSAPVELVRDVVRLPPPPPGLRSDDGQVYLRWRFDRDAADADRGVVIERRLPIEEAVERLVAAGSGDRAAARVDEEMGEHPERTAELLWLLARAVARHDAGATEPERRVAAARAHGVLDDNEAPLARLAHDPDPAVRTAALEAMGLGDPSPVLVRELVGALDGEMAPVAARVIEQLARRAGGASCARGGGRAELRGALDRTLAAGRAPMETAEALRALGDEAAARATTTKLLQDPSRRAAGARAAMQLASPALEPVVIAAMTAAPPAEDALLIEVLGALGRKLGPEGRTAILRGLGAADAVVRSAAARAAGTVGERKARSRLVDALADTDSGVRAAAVTSLVALVGDEAADEYFRPLKDHSPQVRAALAAVLNAHPIEAGRPLLRRLCTDEEPAVQLAARGPVAAPPPAPAVDDSDARLLHATQATARARAAADWLLGHVEHPAATTTRTDRTQPPITISAVVR